MASKTLNARFTQLSLQLDKLKQANARINNEVKRKLAPVKPLNRNQQKPPPKKKVTPKPGNLPQPQRTRKPNLNTGSTSTRAQARVTDNLSKSITSRVGPPEHNYMRCRLDPFSFGSSMGIPDGSATRKIVIDYRHFQDINITANCNVFILAMPTLPCSGFIKCDTVTAANFTDQTGYKVLIPASGTTGNNSMNADWFPMMVPPEWWVQASSPVFSGTTNQPLQSANPYGATRARIVTFATKIYYTGPANQCAGTLTANDVQITAEDGSITLNPQTVSMYELDNSFVGGSTTKIPAGTINTLPITTNIATTNFSQSAVVSRPESGGLLLAKHTTKDYKWKPVFESPLCLQNNNATLTNFTATSFTAASTTTAHGGALGCPYFLDFDWLPTLITISGCTTGMTYRVEQSMCVEFDLQIGSAFERLAMQAPDLIGQVAAAFKAAQTIPTMLPSNTSMEPWYIQAVRIARTIGKTLFLG